MNPDMMGGGMPMNGMNMNGMTGMNGMGGMNGMMGMSQGMGMQPNPGMPRQQPANSGAQMPQVQQMQQMQQMLMRKLFSQDRGQLPVGWQQTFNPNERVKAVSEIVTQMRTLNPTVPEESIFSRVAMLENETFNKSSSRENYINQIANHKRNIWLKRQNNVTNLQSSMQNNARMMGAQGGMFPGGQPNMTMPGGVPNQFGSPFASAQTPRPNPPGTPQPGGRFGQPPGGMMGSMGMQPSGNPQVRGPQQMALTPEELRVVEQLATSYFQAAPPQARIIARQQFQDSMPPQQWQQVLTQYRDPVLLYYRLKAESTVRQAKLNNARNGNGMGAGVGPSGGQNAGGGGLRFTTGMNPAAAGGTNQGPSHPNTEEAFKAFMAQQEQGINSQGKGEPVVPISQGPGMQQQRTATPNQANFGPNGQPVSQSGQIPGMGAPTRPPGPQPAMPTTQGPNATPVMPNLNQPFNQNPSPQIGQRTPNPGQNNGQVGQQPAPALPANMTRQQLLQFLENVPLPKPYKDQLASMPHPQALQRLSVLFQKRDHLQGLRNPNPQGQAQAQGQLPVQQHVQGQMGTNAAAPGMLAGAGGPNPQLGVPMNASRPMVPTWTPEQQRVADSSPFPRPPLLLKMLPNIPPEVRTWGHLKMWASQQASEGRVPPQVVENLNKMQMQLIMLQMKKPGPNAGNVAATGLNNANVPQAGLQAGNTQPGQGGGMFKAPPAPMLSAGAVAGVMTKPGMPPQMLMPPRQLTDEQCELFRQKSPALKNMPNDQIRRMYLQKVMADMNKLQNAGAQAQNNQQNQGPNQTPQPPNKTPAIPQQPTPKVGTSQQAPAAAKPKAAAQKNTGNKRPSSDDVVEVPNPADGQSKDGNPAKPQLQQQTDQGKQAGQQKQARAAASQAGPVVQPSPAGANALQTKLLTLKQEALSSLRQRKTHQYSGKIRADLEKFLFQHASYIKDSEKAILFWYRFLDPNNDKVARDLIRHAEILKMQFASLTEPYRLKDQITATKEEIATGIMSLKQLLQKVSQAYKAKTQGNRKQQPGQIGGGGGAMPAAPTAPTATMSGGDGNKKPPASASQVKKGKDNDQPPAAPTTEKAPPFTFERPTGDGVPKYAETANKGLELALPQKRRKLINGAPSPVNGSPQSGSPQANGKSPKPGPVELKLKCKVENCPKGKTGFSSAAELTAHHEAEHEEKMPEDPLAYALDFMRKAWYLDNEGKSKSSGKGDRSGKQILGPGGVPMSRAATGAGNGAAPRTPQSTSNNAGTGSKPATPAISAGKLPGKAGQGQAPPTPPQDPWAECAITAQQIASILPVPPEQALIAPSSLAGLTPDSAGKGATEKSTVSPKTPRQGAVSEQEKNMLNAIQIKDVSANVGGKGSGAGGAAKGSGEGKDSVGVTGSGGGNDLDFNFDDFGADLMMSGTDNFDDIFGGGGGTMGVMQDTMGWDDLFPDMKEQGKKDGKKTGKGGSSSSSSKMDMQKHMQFADMDDWTSGMSNFV